MNLARLVTTAAIAIMGSGLQAHAGTVRCMSHVLDYVLSDFDNAREGAGVRVRDGRDFSRELNLGTNIDERSVEITDMKKNGYRVDIHLYSIEGKISRGYLKSQSQWRRL